MQRLITAPQLFDLQLSLIQAQRLTKMNYETSHKAWSSVIRMQSDFDLFARACAEIKSSIFWTRKWPTSLGFSVYFLFFSAFPFSPFLIFSLQWLTFYWACFQLKNSWGSIIETGTFYHGVAKCSGRKFRCEFFTQVSEHFRAYFKLLWADHSDLDITGKISSSCRTLE